MSLDKATISESVIASCCADFTVDFALLEKNDSFYVAYYDPHHRLTLAYRPAGDSTWQYSQPEGEWLPARQRYMHQTEFDSHNYLTLALDSDGCLHLSGNMHKDKLVYFRASRPADIHSLVCQPMTGERESSTTYPLFFTGRQGELLFRYRDGESGNGDDIYNRWDAQQQRWHRLLEQPLLSGGGERNAYARLPVWGPDDQWHMIWMWRETPHCETNNNLSYARSPDLLHWYSSDGRPLSLPITRASGDVIDSAGPEEGLINMSQNLAFDHQGRPVISYHRYDAAGHSQAYIARPQAGGWQRVQLSQWTGRWDFKGMGSIPAEREIGAARLTDAGLAVSFVTADEGHGQWLLDEQSLQVVATLDPAPPPLPAHYFVPRQQLHASAQVNILPQLYQPVARHFLRWESLPIQRDIAPDLKLAAGQLSLISLPATPPSGRLS